MQFAEKQDYKNETRWWWWRRWRGNENNSISPRRWHGTREWDTKSKWEKNMKQKTTADQSGKCNDDGSSDSSEMKISKSDLFEWKRKSKKKNFLSPCKSLLVSPCFAAHFAISKAWMSSHKYELNRKTQAEALLCVSRHDSASGREEARSERRKKREKNFMNFNEQELCRVEPLNSHRRQRRQRQNGDEKIFFFIIFFIFILSAMAPEELLVLNEHNKKIKLKILRRAVSSSLPPIPHDGLESIASRAHWCWWKTNSLVAENLIISGWVDLAWFIEKFFHQQLFFSVIFISRRFHVWLFAIIARLISAPQSHRRFRRRDHHYVWTQFTGIMHTRCENKNVGFQPIPTDSELNTVNVQRVHVWTPLIITQAEKRN